MVIGREAAHCNGRCHGTAEQQSYNTYIECFVKSVQSTNFVNVWMIILSKKVDVVSRFSFILKISKINTLFIRSYNKNSPIFM